MKMKRESLSSLLSTSLPRSSAVLLEQMEVMRLDLMQGVQGVDQFKTVLAQLLVSSMKQSGG